MVFRLALAVALSLTAAACSSHGNDSTVKEDPAPASVSVTLTIDTGLASRAFQAVTVPAGQYSLQLKSAANTASVLVDLSASGAKTVTTSFADAQYDAVLQSDSASFSLTPVQAATLAPAPSHRDASFDTGASANSVADVECPSC